MTANGFQMSSHTSVVTQNAESTLRMLVRLSDRKSAGFMKGKRNMTNEEALEYFISCLKTGATDLDKFDAIIFKIKAVEQAISALESIDRITAERDAAVKDMRGGTAMLRSKVFASAAELTNFVNQNHIRREDIVTIVYRDLTKSYPLWLFYWERY